MNQVNESVIKGRGNDSIDKIKKEISCTIWGICEYSINTDWFISIPAIIDFDWFNNLSEWVIKKISSTISYELQKYKKSMIQYSEQDIEEFINKKQVLVVWDLKNDKLVGFAKYMKWDWLNEFNTNTIEVWTLVVTEKYKNLSYWKFIMKNFLNQLKEKFKEDLLISWITSSNVLSQILFKSLKAQKIEKPLNVECLVSWVEFYSL